MKMHLIASFLFLATCLQTSAQTQLLQASGKLSFLRVHEVGSGWGPSTDQLDAEVIIKFSNDAQKAYGFQLRDDKHKFVRQGMLDLLRDAFQNNYQVTIDYEISAGKKNGKILRVWLTK